MLIGDKIRKAREDKHLSPKYLADLLRISVRTYESIEHNKRRVYLEEAELLGRELGFTPNELLTCEPRLIFESCFQKAGNHDHRTTTGTDQAITALQEHIATLRQALSDKDCIIEMLKMKSDSR